MSYSGGANVRPEDLRSFASYLHQFSEELQNLRSNLTSRFEQLGETWRDEKYDEYAAELYPALRGIEQFEGVSEQFVHILLTKADKIDEYLTA